MPWHMVTTHQECQYLLANEQPKASQSVTQAHDGMLTQSHGQTTRQTGKAGPGWLMLPDCGTAQVAQTSMTGIINRGVKGQGLCNTTEHQRWGQRARQPPPDQQQPNLISNNQTTPHKPSASYKSSVDMDTPAMLPEGLHLTSCPLPHPSLAHSLACTPTHAHPPTNQPTRSNIEKRLGRKTTALACQANQSTAHA